MVGLRLREPTKTLPLSCYSVAGSLRKDESEEPSVVSEDKLRSRRTERNDHDLALSEKEDVAPGASSLSTVVRAFFTGQASRPDFLH